MWRWLAARRDALQRRLVQLGGWPARRVTWTLALLVSAWAMTDLLALRIGPGLAQSTYDTMVRARFHTEAVDPRIVIVDIDEASLARMSREFGRWPWPRDTLATVLDHLERQNPSAIVWDVLFADPDRLNPGGDAAFDAAAMRSRHSHFPVVRLPTTNDSVSQITRDKLPGLWVSDDLAPPQAQAATRSTVALIPPAFPAMAAGRLGYNNGYVDSDGVLRRYRYAEQLADGSVIQSIALGVTLAVEPERGRALLARTLAHPPLRGELIDWRKRAGDYPRISFADLFEVAEGGAARRPMPSFAGKVILIGSTAPSLHDIHPTPLSAYQPGVESLATAIDNALNGHHFNELPAWAQAALAVALCLGLALWVQLRSVATLQPAIILVPLVLMAISYLSLNLLPVFIDLHLAAGLALLLLATLRFWNNLRRDYWCRTDSFRGELLLWPWMRQTPWVDAAVDRLLDAMERHAPDCRVVLMDAINLWPIRPRWPELAMCVAVIGPRDAVQRARATLGPAMYMLARTEGECVALAPPASREQQAATAFQAWTKLMDAAKTRIPERQTS